MVARLLFVLALLAGLSGPASAQDREVPYWATIRASELNMRVGPSADYKIAWVYRRPGLPVKVIRVMEGWRLIEDPAGDKGWVVARLLSPDRGAIVTGEGSASMRDGPSAAAGLKWQVEPGVNGLLGECESGWCEITIGNRKGWIEQPRLWGAGEP
ncbi:hypothetical protein K3172_10070 [Qipengyuania sp. 6B39]|uniref:SH3 domain-containing protein n=1 Tax=Qipengyuania proteolytica TaxID=2867239 RepID=UPI001C89662F|nr:SH3 domain-containing protein [Qipengyuania proteolytica]MBX7496197.1 hypothetical protein [Qipengyuania proteolytica]